jgi:ubiquinone/menaquinone biosynthesis C-methylase UbiE
MVQGATYIHGTHPEEQARLSLLNDLTNASFIDFLKIEPGDSVLEVGSGLGILANSVSTRFPVSTVTGVEIADEQLATARGRFSARPNLEFHKGDALSLALMESSFEVVYCRYILEHVADPATVLSEMFRVLKPGGRFFAQENNILIHTLYPDCPAYSVILRKFVELQSQMGGDAEIGKKLFSLLKQAGFRSINLSIGPEVHHHDLPTFDPWIVNSIELLKGAKPHLLQMDGVTEPLFEKAISELKELTKNPYASAYFYWNRASAIKP